MNKVNNFSPHIVITGASGGLGKEIALAFARANVLIGLHYSKNEKVVYELSRQITHKNANSYLIRADFSEKFNVKTFIDKINSQKQKIDVLIINAGAVSENILLKTSENEWERIMRINYKTPAKILGNLADQLLAENCHVIIIGSHTGLKGKTGLAAYSAAKGALIGFAFDAAKKLAGKNIFVNVVLPGWLETEMTRRMSATDFKKNVSENLLRRGTNTKEVAEFILSLTKMRNVSGQVFALDSRPIVAL
ncbi:MAG: hypothetical protein DRI44_03850 [Chlamydiae bacterium]|nr:MAG: hypothetical protein DRI44_03850 [Chlamydiota bacterium]